MNDGILLIAVWVWKVIHCYMSMKSHTIISNTCYTLQHTALQHTATHCNTLHCNTLQHIQSSATLATHCNTLHCNTLQHTATHCNTYNHQQHLLHITNSIEIMTTSIAIHPLYWKHIQLSRTLSTSRDLYRNIPPLLKTHPLVTKWKHIQLSRTLLTSHDLYRNTHQVITTSIAICHPKWKHIQLSTSRELYRNKYQVEIKYL